jgi:hypothetical protein
MKPIYCQYCGELLENRCGCLRELAEYEAERIEEYENRPETQAGYIFEDKMDMWRNER